MIIRNTCSVIISPVWFDEASGFVSSTPVFGKILFPPEKGSCDKIVNPHRSLTTLFHNFDQLCLPLNVAEVLRHNQKQRRAPEINNLYRHQPRQA
jgi:hypothetical protein